MKRIFTLLLCISMLICLCSCGGDVNNVKIKNVSSDNYSSEDINAAINTIIREFDVEWNGCKLTEIYYAGDDFSSDYQEFADRYNKDEVIVLLSSFDVDDSGGDGSLDPNSTYDGWNWILVRDKGEQWKHVDHGY